MSRLSSVRSSIKSVLKNLKRMLLLVWSTNKGLTVGYYGTSGLGAFFPIFTSYIYKLLVDELIKYQNIAATIPVILIVLLGARYIANISWDFVMWALKGTYFDYLFRYKVQNILNYKFCDKLSRLDVAHLEDTKTQDLITKARDTYTWRPPDFLRAFSYLFNNFVSYISSFILLIHYGWFIPVLITISGLPRLYLRARLGKLQWSIYGSGAPEVRQLWYLGRLLTEKISIIESRIFQSQKALITRYKKVQKYLYNLNKKPVVDFIKVAMLPQFFEVGAIFVFAYLKLPHVLRGDMSIGDFTFFVSLLDRVTNSAGDMILNFGWMYEENLYVNHFFDVINLPVLIKEKKDARLIGAWPNPPKIEFNNVSFSYPGTKNLVLRNISFTITPKKNTAIVGPNGAGKTTIIRLLCRFYDVTSGKILINGTDIKDVKLSDWYKYIGTLFQEFMHYDFTVKENIMLGNTNVVNKRLMREVAERSGAGEFIEKLPKKYNQLLGRQFEGGVELSQGQWQKIAIARAFYDGAPILILDEPTSAIDSEAEYEIFKNLKAYYKNKSLLLISHRFSTVRNADKIIVLDQGKIVEEGSHEQLLVKKGLYERMFMKQAKGYR